MSDLNLPPLLPVAHAFSRDGDEYFEAFEGLSVKARERILREALDFQAALVKELLPYQDEAVRSRARIAELEADLASLLEYHARTLDAYIGAAQGVEP